jgi:hypothetical protein
MEGNESVRDFGGTFMQYPAAEIYIDGVTLFARGYERSFDMDEVIKAANQSGKTHVLSTFTPTEEQRGFGFGAKVLLTKIENNWEEKFKTQFQGLGFPHVIMACDWIDPKEISRAPEVPFST